MVVILCLRNYYFSQLCSAIWHPIGYTTSSPEFAVSSYSSPPRSRLFQEFRCPGCGPQEAIRSRPRGFFEIHVLPFLFLQVVRCERCYQRRYVLRTVPALEREARIPNQSMPASGSARDRHVA
jgi:hypothetical protein